MARTTDQIYNELTTRYRGEMQAIGIIVNPAAWSQTNLLRVVFFAVALVMVTLEQAYDQLRAEIIAYIANMTPGRVQWYANMAKAFQFGYNLVPEHDYYNNTNVTAAQVGASKIIKHAAVVEQAVNLTQWGLRIKVATTAAGDLAPLSNVQLQAFVAYMEKVKYGGVPLLITTGVADSLFLQLDVYYNPLVLNNQGQRLDGTNNTPVQDAIKQHLLNLPFNGRFNLTQFVDSLQKVDGVSDPVLKLAESQYAALPRTVINVEYVPDAGYLRIVNPQTDLLINWIAKNV